MLQFFLWYVTLSLSKNKRKMREKTSLTDLFFLQYTGLHVDPNSILTNLRRINMYGEDDVTIT